MFPYIVIFLMLWFLVATRYIGVRLRNSIDYSVVLIFLFLFVSLRYRTGYDWDNYENFFELLKTNTNRSITTILSLSSANGKEPLFGIFAYTLASFGINYYFVQFLATATLFKGIASLLKLFPTPLSKSFGLAFVFSLFGYSLFFSATKQSFAAGIFLMYVVAWHEKKPVVTRLFLSVCAVLFQYSSLLYFIVFHLSVGRFSWRHHTTIYLISSLVFFINLALPSIVGTVAYKIIEISLPFEYILQKANWYFFDRDNGISLTGIVSAAFFHLLWGWALLSFSTNNKLDRFGNLAFGFVGHFIAFQAVFIQYSVFTNRLLYVASFFIAAIYFYPVFKNFVSRQLVLCLMFAYCLSYYMLFLISTSAGPFVPYKCSSIGNMAESFDDDALRLMDYRYEKAQY